MVDFDIYNQFKQRGRYDPSYTRVVMIEKYYANILNINNNFHYRMQTVLNLIRRAQNERMHSPSIVVPTDYLIPTVKKILEELGCSCHKNGASSYVEWSEGLEI